MSTNISMVARSHEENWLPILELAVEEVFEIMLGCRVKPVSPAEPKTARGWTAVVGLAGALCGILTFSCDPKTAREVARAMLGADAGSEEQVSDALGEICNMIAGNFKNKLARTDGACLLSLPTVIKGDEYSLRSLADGENLETVMMFAGAPVSVALQLHG